MSIERATPPAPVTAITAGQELRSRPLNTEAAARLHRTEPDNQTRVELSHPRQQQTADAAADVNLARVAALRSALQAGELPVDSFHIARALVADLLDFPLD